MAAVAFMPGGAGEGCTWRLLRDTDRICVFSPCPLQLASHGAGLDVSKSFFLVSRGPLSGPSSVVLHPPGMVVEIQGTQHLCWSLLLVRPLLSGGGGLPARSRPAGCGRTGSRRKGPAACCGLRLSAAVRLPFLADACLPFLLPQPTRVTSKERLLSDARSHQLSSTVFPENVGPTVGEGRPCMGLSYRRESRRRV